MIAFDVLYFNTNIIYVACSAGGLFKIALGEAAWQAFTARHACRRDPGSCAPAVRQLNEYFAGGRREFSLELALSGTDFFLRAWNEVRNIPYGQTRSYREIAVALGNAGAVRAVGAANARNPLPIVIPCHRVVGSSGSLTGYAGGLSMKERLLGLESRHAGRGKSQ